MIVKKVPLVRVSENAVIYFDFEKNVPYIQHFSTRETRKYSFSLTFWLSQSVMGGAAIAGIVLDRFFEFPVLVSIIIAFFIGIVLGRLYIKLTITNKFAEAEYIRLSKNEVSKAISNSKNFRVLRITEVFVTLLLFFTSLRSLSNDIFKGSDFIMTALGMFGIIMIHGTIHPKQAMKAHKILKKQLKAGNFE